MGNLLSVIIPAYNEEQMIARTIKKISGVLNTADIAFEILFVNDGSKDLTWEKIEEIANKNDCVCGISFSSNFGKEAAMFAGLSKAKGNCCVVIDCDLQHPPEK